MVYILLQCSRPAALAPISMVSLAAEHQMWLQVLGLSGIVALFFSGICHAHYSYYCVDLEAQITLRRFFEFAAFLSETFVFAYLGLQARGSFRALLAVLFIMMM